MLKPQVAMKQEKKLELESEHFSVIMAHRRTWMERKQDGAGYRNFEDSSVMAYGHARYIPVI